MVRKVLLVVSIAFAAALLTQCGQQKTCNTSNCTGCCDSTMTCQTGQSSAACGKGGVQCVACTGSQTCSALQTCSSGGTGGGSGNTGGGTGNTGGSFNTGGGTATGGSGNTGGGSGLMSCNIQQPSCPGGSVCLISSSNASSASCFPGCDPAGTGCGAGKKCTYVTSGMTFARECVDAGTVAAGGTCVQDGNGDNCQAGMLCTSDNKCTQFCSLSAGGCPSGSSCSGFLNTMIGEFPTICEPGCSLLNQDCMAGQGCLPAQGGGSICVTVGTLDAGSACVNPQDCAKGSACVNTGTNKCLAFCALDGGSPRCAMGTNCTSSNPALPQGAGFCL
jgi:hypothetical protein